jgi:hypothetical protein
MLATADPSDTDGVIDRACMVLNKKLYAVESCEYGPL